MSAAVQAPDPSRVLARLHAGLDELHALDLSGLGDDELLELMREHERLRRRLPTGEHAFVQEAADRGVAAAVWGALDAWVAAWAAAPGPG